MVKVQQNDNVLTDLFSDDGSRRNVSIYLAFLLVAFLYHASVFWFIMGDDIQSKYAQQEYTIEFEESSEIFTDSRTIDDGEKATIDFTAPPNLFDSNSGFGLLLITISYTETSGEFGDPCDTISADLSVTDVSADWKNENNELSGVSSDCETISLVLHIYPDYNGESMGVVGMDEFYWNNAWSNSSHGQGMFELDVEVIVNEPITSGIPTVSDTDEKADVTWEAVFFDVSVRETS